MSFHRCEIFDQIQQVEVSPAFSGALCIYLDKQCRLGSNDGEMEVCVQAAH